LFGPGGLPGPSCLVLLPIAGGLLPLHPSARNFPFVIYPVRAERRRAAPESKQAPPFDSAACGRYAQGERGILFARRPPRRAAVAACARIPGTAAPRAGHTGNPPRFRNTACAFW